MRKTAHLFIALLVLAACKGKQKDYALETMPALDSTIVVKEKQKPEETKDFCLMTTVILQDYLSNFSNLKGDTTIEDTTDVMGEIANILAESKGKEKKELKRNNDLSQRWLSKFTFFNATRTYIYDGTNDAQSDIINMEGAWTWKCTLLSGVDENRAKTEYNALVKLMNECKFKFILLSADSVVHDEKDSDYKSYTTFWLPNYGIANMIGMDIDEGYKNMVVEIERSCYVKDNCFITFRCYQRIKD